MTYRPLDAVYGPPWAAWAPSLLYLTLAALIACGVVAAEHSSSTSRLFLFVVAGDTHRALSSRAFAGLLCASALAAVLKTGMRGVRVRGDGVEFRDILSLGWPRARRYRWAQIDQIVLDQKTSIALDLWDGTRAFLPPVMDRGSLSRALEKVGYARAIPVRGGEGLYDFPEDGEFDEDEA